VQVPDLQCILSTLCFSSDTSQKNTKPSTTKKNQTKPRERISSLLNFKFFGPKPSWPEHERVLATLAEWRARIRSRIQYSVTGSGTWAIRGSVLDQCNCVVIERRMCGREGTDMSMVLPTNPHVVLLGKGGVADRVTAAPHSLWSLQKKKKRRRRIPLFMISSL
jgi:hypothetical protein